MVTIWSTIDVENDDQIITIITRSMLRMTTIITRSMLRMTTIITRSMLRITTIITRSMLRMTTIIRGFERDRSLCVKILSLSTRSRASRSIARICSNRSSCVGFGDSVGILLPEDFSLLSEDFSLRQLATTRNALTRIVFLESISTRHMSMRRVVGFSVITIFFLLLIITFSRNAAVLIRRGVF